MSTLILRAKKALFTASASPTRLQPPEQILSRTSVMILSGIAILGIFAFLQLSGLPSGNATPIATASPSSSHQGTGSGYGHPAGDAFAPLHRAEADAHLPLKILATTTLAADLVREIGGDRVIVTSLMGPGVDPHLYKANEDAVRLLRQSDIIIHHGLHLESKLGDVLTALSQHQPVIMLSTGLDEAALLHTAENGKVRSAIGIGNSGAVDPHIWMNVSLWEQTAAYLSTSLGTIDPLYAATYTTEWKYYQRQLQALDAEVRAMIQKIPADKRILVTAHDAFSYYGKAYGLTIKALQGISTSSRFNLSDIREIKEFVLTHKVPALFGESSVSTKGLEALQSHLSAEDYTIVLHDTLYSDALGAPGSPGETYVSMMRTNTKTIATALGAVIPNDFANTFSAELSSKRDEQIALRSHSVTP